jgi:hypothetical protein
MRTMSNESNSIRVRRSVGYVFSGHTFPSLLTGLPTKHILCTKADPQQVGDTEIYLFENADSSQIQGFAAAVNGKLGIGFFPGPTVITQSLLPTNGSKLTLESLLASDACDNPAAYGGVWIGGGGPADYDAFNGVNFVCNGKAREFYYSSSTELSAEPTTAAEKLTCKLVQ